MKQISKKERFYLDLGEAMFMNNMRGIINTETLEVEIYPKADYFFDEEDIAPMVTLLCSGLADHATGASIDMNAGSYVR